jgi:hypothetical protein
MATKRKLVTIQTEILPAVLPPWVSGFVFGGGPEGSGGEPSRVAVWSGALAACIGAPVALRIGVGLAIALIPPLGARCC